MSCVSVGIATWTSKIKTCSVQLMFTDYVVFRSDHCSTSYILKGFLHMVNTWTLFIHSLTFFKPEKQRGIVVMYDNMLSVENVTEQKFLQFHSLLYINLFGKNDVNSLEHDRSALKKCRLIEIQCTSCAAKILAELEVE